MLCADAPVTSLAWLTAEYQRGHGAKYDAVNHGWLDPRRLRRLLASTPLPRAADGRIVLAVDVSNWLRPDAPTGPGLLFCHVYGRGRSADQFIPSRPCSFAAALDGHIVDRRPGRDPAGTGRRRHRSDRRLTRTVTAGVRRAFAEGPSGSPGPALDNVGDS